MQFTLKLLAGAATAGLSFGAAAQPASQAQGASQQQPAGDTAAQSASQAQGASQQQPAGDTAAQQTSGDSTATANANLKPVTAASVKAGDKVNDTKGDPVGKIESVSGKTAVISSGSARAQIPLSSLARNEKGLVIAMTKSQFDAAAKAKTRKQ